MELVQESQKCSLCFSVDAQEEKINRTPQFQVDAPFFICKKILKMFMTEE